MQEIQDDVLGSFKLLQRESFCSFVSCFKIPSPYVGGAGREAGSASEGHSTMSSSWQPRVPLPFIGDSRSTPFAPFDARARVANKELCDISVVSFAPKPPRHERFVNSNYEAGRQQEGGYEKFTKKSGMWGCNCPRPPGQGCSGWKPRPCWVERCFFCRRGLSSWEARLDRDASRDMCYGFAAIFVSEPGEWHEHSDSVNRWKQVCFQCGRLKVLRDYSNVAQQAVDTSAQVERVQDLKDKLKDSINDHRVVCEENEEMQNSMKDLQESVTMLQGAGLESQEALAMDIEKKEDAMRQWGTSNNNCHAWTAQCTKVENQAKAEAASQWRAVQQAEKSAATAKEENEALDESVRNAQSELQFERLNKAAIGETAKFWQDKVKHRHVQLGTKVSLHQKTKSEGLSVSTSGF